MMNACQLSFGTEPQIQYIQEMWQAIGLLTVHDDKGLENTFRVFVSGESEDIVQEFIKDQESNCSIELEVIQEPLTAPGESPPNSDEDNVPPAVYENTREAVLSDSQLNIGISRLNIQTPTPYRIIYHVAMACQLAEDNDDDDDDDDDGDDASSFSPPTCEPGEQETWTQSVSFQIPEAQVRCKVTQGAVDVSLKERVGDGWNTYGPVNVRDKQVCWLPDDRPLTVKECAEGKWQVVVLGIDRQSECHITYERRVV